MSLKIKNKETLISNLQEILAETSNSVGAIQEAEYWLSILTDSYENRALLMLFAEDASASPNKRYKAVGS